jgi:hypothetical protein
MSSYQRVPNAFLIASPLGFAVWCTLATCIRSPKGRLKNISCRTIQSLIFFLKIQVMGQSNMSITQKGKKEEEKENF